LDHYLVLNCLIHYLMIILSQNIWEKRFLFHLAICQPYFQNTAFFF